MVNQCATLDQEQFFEALVTRFGDSKLVDLKTPPNSFFKDPLLKKSDYPRIDYPYSNLIGGLLWLASWMHLNVSFVVNCLSQFFQDPSELHLKAALRVQGYHKATKSLQTKFGGPCLQC